MTPRCVWNSGLDNLEILFRSRLQCVRLPFPHRLTRMHLFATPLGLFSWKRNAWRQSRVCKRVDFVFLRFWFLRHSDACNWTFFSGAFPYLAWHDRLLHDGRAGTARRTSGLFMYLAGRFFIAAATIYKKNIVIAMSLKKKQSLFWYYFWDLINFRSLLSLTNNYEVDYYNHKKI